jgi:hypothetical protein
MTTYRAPGGVLFPALIVAFASVMLASAIADDAAPLFVAFAVGFVIAAVYALLLQPYKITTDETGLVTFHGVLRRRAVPIADVRRIESFSHGQGVSLRFVFSHGRLTLVSWPRFNALADELCRRNPAIERDE